MLRSIRFPTFLSLIGLCCACSPGEGPPPGPITDLSNAVWVAEPVLVTGGARWESVDGEGWLFRNRADLVVCRQDVTADVELTFRVDSETSSYGIEVRRGTSSLWTGVPADTGDSVSLALDLGDTRCARLEVVRRYDLDAKTSSREIENHFSEIQVRSGDVEARFEAGNRANDAMLFRFVRDGVAGQAPDGRNGTFFAGPGEVVAPTDAGRLVVEPENFSSESALFRVQADESRDVKLGPGDRARIEVSVSDQVTLSVEGAPSGRFLWGSPRILGREEQERSRLRAIVLVTLDTMRRDVLSPWGGDPSVTPFLGELAAESVVFDDAWTTAPWTLPSHASMFTGLWPSRHGAGVSETTLPADVPTLAVALREVGWRTLGFAGGELCSSRFGMAQGFERWQDPKNFETKGDELLASVESALEEVASEDTPVFLFANFFDAHALWQAPQVYRDRTGEPALAAALHGQEGWNRLVEGDGAAWRGAIEGEFEITPEARAWMKAAYLAEVAFVDDLLKQLVERLRALGWWDRTLLVITSDHGELLGENGFVSHGARLDTELVQAPLLVRVPGESPRRDGRLVSNVDLFPTILAAAGIEASDSDGQPLFATADDRAWVLAEEHEFLVHPLPAFQKIAPHLFGLQRQGHRHLVWEGGEMCGERRDDGQWVDTDCEVPGEQVLEALEESLGGLRSGDGTPVGEPSGALAESLQALGYM